MNHAWISLGANLGEPLPNLGKALERLDDGKDVFIEAKSSFYRTEAVDFPDQPDFINLCVRLKTIKTPEALLERLLAIQKMMGQGEKEIPFGPRIMDLDLLLYEDFILDTKDLILPHPGMHMRRFVLQPLCDLDPELMHPVFKLTMSQLLEKIPQDTQKVERIP